VSAAIPPSRFKQVLLNLLINAADALAGKGRIVVTMARKDDRRIQISVADNGPGIPADIYLKVFDPFFTTKGVGKGTGLGLFVCHTIVSRYGGEIALESKPGQGATFTVTLPMMV
jgi:signal transduction histidine kinase